jgi:hypothetical protein
MVFTPMFLLRITLVVLGIGFLTRLSLFTNRERVAIYRQIETAGNPRVLPLVALRCLSRLDREMRRDFILSWSFLGSGWLLLWVDWLLT